MFLLTASLSAQLALVAGGLACLAGRTFLASSLRSAWSGPSGRLPSPSSFPSAMALDGAGTEGRLLAARLGPRTHRHLECHRSSRPCAIRSWGSAPMGAAPSPSKTVSAAPVERTPLGRSEFPHPHNAYLQVWYELGVVGALLLGGLGLSLVRAIGDAQRRTASLRLGPILCRCVSFRPPPTACGSIGFCLPFP